MPLDDDEPAPERRYRRFMVSMSDILPALEGRLKINSDPLPEDWKPIAAYCDQERYCFMVLLWSSAWPIVPDGEIVPLHNEPWLQLRENI